MKIYHRTTQDKVFYDPQKNLWFPVEHPAYRRMMLEISAGQAKLVDPPPPAPEEVISQKELNDAVLEWFIHNTRTKADALKKRYEAVLQAHESKKRTGKAG